MFKTHRNTDNGEIRQGVIGLQGPQRPVGVGIHKPLTNEIRLRIDQGVDQLESEIGDGQGIDIGIKKGHRQAALPFFPDSAGFRNRDVGQCGFNNRLSSVLSIRPQD